MNIIKRIEHEIDSATHNEIAALRNVCFPKDPKRYSYGKQLPHFRFLSYNGGTLVGHLAVDHRVISFNHRPYAVFGIIDLCVAIEHRHQGIAKAMLAQVESLAKEHDIDCLALLASVLGLYRDAGFTPINTVCQWLDISEHTSHGIAVEFIEDELMIKPLSEHFIAEGPIDFLGYMF